MSAQAEPWQRRFTLPSVGMPDWAPLAPDRLVYSANTSGAWQVYAWNRATGTRRRVTRHPTGARIRKISPDGRFVTWFADQHGSEVGTWLCQPFAGGETAPLVRDVPPAWRTGLALGPDGAVAVGIATADGHQVRTGRIGGRTRLLYGHEQSAAPAGFSGDGRLVAVAHCEHGNLTAQALRVYRVPGEVVGELSDGPRHGIMGPVFSPAGHRIAFLHERFDLLRPGVWDPLTGRRQDFELDLPGDVEIVDWWAHQDALAVVHSHHGRDEIYRLDVPTGRLTRVPHPPGTITDLAVRPDLAVWYRWSAGGTSPRIEVAGATVLEHTPPVTGRPYTPWQFTANGHTVHGFLALPTGSRPYPTVFLVHGGPHQHDADTWNPRVQALVDHGWAVALVNYRGSAGHGKAWLDRTTGDPGLPEVQDIVAGRADLIRRGVADPSRVAVAGSSWGGYLTLLTIGVVPDGWCAAAAFSPLADLVSAYPEQAVSVRSLLRLLFGGTPDQCPELYAERNPLTYAHRITTPLLVVAGENDTRSPISQVTRYCRRLDELGVPHRLLSHPTGHTNLTVPERIRQTTALLSFLDQGLRSSCGTEQGCVTSFP